MTKKILSFDSRKAREEKKARIDGVSYTIRPLGGKEYLQLSANASKLADLNMKDATPEQIQNVQDEMFDLITPLFSPADKFVEWQKSCKAESEFAYRQIMTELVAACMPNVHADE